MEFAFKILGNGSGENSHGIREVRESLRQYRASDYHPDRRPTDAHRVKWHRMLRSPHCHRHQRNVRLHRQPRGASGHGSVTPVADSPTFRKHTHDAAGFEMAKRLLQSADGIASFPREGNRIEEIENEVHDGRVAPEFVESEKPDRPAKGQARNRWVKMRQVVNDRHVSAGRSGAPPHR